MDEKEGLLLNLAPQLITKVIIKVSELGKLRKGLLFGKRKSQWEKNLKQQTYSRSEFFGIQPRVR